MEGTENDSDRIQQALDNIQKSGRGVVGSGYGRGLLQHFVLLQWRLGIQLLLEKGADPNCKDGLDCTILYEASPWRDVEIVRLLLEKGAEVDGRSGYARKTALMHACQLGQPQTVKLLLEWGADVRIRDEDGGKTAWDYAKGKADIKAVLKQARSRVGSGGVVSWLTRGHRSG
jgi:Ankyrin repeats (3 copies)